MSVRNVVHIIMGAGRDRAQGPRSNTLDGLVSFKLPVALRDT